MASIARNTLHGRHRTGSTKQFNKMSDSEELARKKRTRAAHRGSVTKIIKQVYECLESLDDTSSSRLRQQKTLLSEKERVLSALDEEIMNLVSDEELDTEVEQVDEQKGKITLAIIDIDDALRSPPRATTTTTSTTSTGIEPSVVTPRIASPTRDTVVDPVEHTLEAEITVTAPITVKLPKLTLS